MGYLNFQTYYHQPKTHYLQNPSSETVEFKRIRILEKLYETSFTNAYLTLLEFKDTKPASGKLILYQEKDSLSAAYRLGEKILTTATIVSIDEPRNPGAFSYKKYLEILGCMDN